MLCSVENIYTYLKQTDDNPSLQSLTEAQWIYLIEAVSAKIENICQRKFEATDYTSYFAGEGGKLLFVDNFPIISLTSIDLVDIGNISIDSLDLDFIKINYELGQLQSNSNFIEGIDNYKVVYRGGFEEIPDDLNLICVEEVLRSANLLDQNENLKYNKTGDIQVTYFSSVENNKNLTEKLNKYINNF